MWCVYLLRCIRFFLSSPSSSSCSFVWLTGHCPHYINQYFFACYGFFFFSSSSPLSSFFLSSSIRNFRFRSYRKKNERITFSSMLIFSSSFTRLPMFSINVVNSLSFEWLFAYTQLDFLSLACALTLRFHSWLLRRQFVFHWKMPRLPWKKEYKLTSSSKKWTIRTNVSWISSFLDLGFWRIFHVSTQQARTLVEVNK